MSSNEDKRRPAPILAKRSEGRPGGLSSSVRHETTSKRPLPGVPTTQGGQNDSQVRPLPSPPLEPPQNPLIHPPQRIMMKEKIANTPPPQRPPPQGAGRGETQGPGAPRGEGPGPGNNGPNKPNKPLAVGTLRGEGQGPRGESPGPGIKRGEGSGVSPRGGAQDNRPKPNKPSPPGTLRGEGPAPGINSPKKPASPGTLQGEGPGPGNPLLNKQNKPSPRGESPGPGSIRGEGSGGPSRGGMASVDQSANSPTFPRRITSARNGVSLSTPTPLPPTSISPKRNTTRDSFQTKNSKSLSNLHSTPPPVPPSRDKSLSDLHSLNKPPVPVRSLTLSQPIHPQGSPAGNTGTVQGNKPAIPPKPAVLSEVEHTKLCDGFKKLSNANKQLLAVARSGFDIAATKTVDFKALEQECNDLNQFNTKFAQYVRDAAKELNHSKTCKIACLTLDITNFTIIICAALKITAHDGQTNSESFFKQCLKAITTVQNSLYGVIANLKEVSDKIDASVIPQLDLHAKKINSILSGLVGSKVTGKLVSATTTLEVEAASRAVLTSIFKLICSFNQPVLDQSLILDAKTASCCISQLWATLTDEENISTNTNLLAVPELREKIMNFASDVKASFAVFMQQTKRLVSNPSKLAFQELQKHFQPIKSLLREIVGFFYVFSNTDTTALQSNPSVSPSAKFYQIADAITSDPEPIVPPPPLNETESVIDLPDNYVPEPEWVWDEPEKEEGRVLFSESGALRCATLNKLIIHITSNELANLDSVKTFLTTYRSFTTPEVLLKKLVDRYHVPPDRSQADAKTIKLRCLNCLKQLILTQSENFSDSFIQQLRKLEEIDSSFASVVSTTLQKKQEMSQKTTNEINNLTVEEIIPLSAAKLLFVISEEEIARQLTLVDFRIYQAIKPEELLNQAWSKAKYKHRAKNVLTLIARSTALTKWVSSVILWQDNLRSRVRAFTKIINIAQHLRKLNNFNSLMAILAGVNTSAVYRLKFTREQLPDNIKQILNEITELMNPTSSYGNYRAALHDVNPPCIPFLGTYLTDITFIEDGNPDYIQGLINYRKRELVYNVIRDIQQYQQRGYPEGMINIAYFLTELPSNDENSLYDLSLIEEPRGATLEQLL